MSRRGQLRGHRGYFGIALYHPKREVNVGSLMRTAALLGASFVAVVGKRFRPQGSDTLKSYRHIPYFEFESIDKLFKMVPFECQVVGIELTDQAQELKSFSHPKQAIYLLGAEDHGLPKEVLDRCHKVVKLQGEFSMNVAVAGSIVLYHREAL